MYMCYHITYTVVYVYHFVHTHPEFLHWKDDIQHETNSEFVKSTGSKKGDDTHTTYFYCNRSGFFASKSSGRRHSKLQGSAKIDAHCTAAITMTKQVHSGNILAYACKTHYGHQCTLGHIRLQTSEREVIAGKLAQGVRVQHILDTVRDNLGDKFQRIHLITRKDIANIEKAYGLKVDRRHDDDATSVMLWVEEMKTKADENPVLIYKPQGSSTELSYMHINDFVLAIQTPLQAEMLKRFGNNVLCIDATHGTNGYDFSLITLIVIDEFGEGYPVAWCLSNRTDLTVLLNLFKSKKQRVGSITPKWIMSDDAQQFYSAWIGVFGMGPQKLLCIWHVDRAWRGNLNSIRDKQLAQTIYHNLRVLLEETDQDKFEQMLKKTTKQLSKSPLTQDFLKYFNTYYAKRKEEWAICFRRSSLINTNMYVESFHRVLKHLYLKGKTNKRVDKCIQTLMKYERDKGFDRLTKLEKGKLSGRITTILRRHNASKKLSTTSVHVVDGSTWKVKSSDSKREYTIVKELSQCPINCALKCIDCNVCVHIYYCNCMDAVINHTICKHIHLVERCTNGKETQLLERKAIDCNERPSDTHPQLLYALRKQEEPADLTNLKERIIRTLSSIATQVKECNSIDGLLHAQKHIQIVSNTISLDNFNTVPRLQSKTNEPLNKKILPQRPFKSTKTKRKTAMVRLAKPTQKDKELICDLLFSH